MYVCMYVSSQQSPDILPFTAVIPAPAVDPPNIVRPLPRLWGLLRLGASAD